jgi:hypothetical protein
MAMSSLNLSTEELRIKQGEFEGTRQELAKALRMPERVRQQFLRKFPASKIDRLTLDQYKVKCDSKDSFCYFLETKLQRLGDMHGATAFKFGIYFGIEKSDPNEKYRWVRRFGNDQVTAFANVKAAIVGLLEAGNRGDLATIKANNLSPMFKGKILATYYPDKFLNIFAREHLEFFLDKIGIPYGEHDDEVDERELLMAFKNSDAVMSSWPTYEFSEFLYYAFGRPRTKTETQKELEEYIEDPKDYPKLSDVRSVFIERKICSQTSRAKGRSLGTPKPPIDFEKEARINKKLGTRGEEIVFAAEKDRLRDAGRADLAARVRWVSPVTDSLGYDVASFDDDGRERLIEVKSTTRPPEEVASFLISSNQYRQAKELKNYYFYVVFEAKSVHPKVWPIKDPLQYENKGMVLEPVSFRVTVNAVPKETMAVPGRG